MLLVTNKSIYLFLCDLDFSLSLTRGLLLHLFLPWIEIEENLMASMATLKLNAYDEKKKDGSWLAYAYNIVSLI